MKKRKKPRNVRPQEWDSLIVATKLSKTPTCPKNDHNKHRTLNQKRQKTKSPLPPFHDISSSKYREKIGTQVPT